MPTLLRSTRSTRNTDAACRLARRRSAWMKGRTRLGIDARREVRHAIEVRHESFLTPTFIELLRAHAIALVIAETAGRWPLYEDLTADFVYIRLHGMRSCIEVPIVTRPSSVGPIVSGSGVVGGNRKMRVRLSAPRHPRAKRAMSIASLITPMPNCALRSMRRR